MGRREKAARVKEWDSQRQPLREYVGFRRLRVRRDGGGCKRQRHRCHDCCSCGPGAHMADAPGGLTERFAGGKYCVCLEEEKEEEEEEGKVC